MKIFVPRRPFFDRPLLYLSDVRVCGQSEGAGACGKLRGHRPGNDRPDFENKKITKAVKKYKKVIYADIDGTMTDAPGVRWGNPNKAVIDKIKEATKDNLIVVWTAGGWQYAKDFCKKYEIEPYAILPKPDIIVDDILTIRTPGIIQYVSPKEFI